MDLHCTWESTAGDCGSWGRGAGAATLGEQAGIWAPAAAALSWLSKRCAPRGPQPPVCLSPSMAPTPPHQAAPRGVIGWMVDFRVTFLPKVSCVRFLKYEAFCQVLCISALSLDAWLPLYLRVSPSSSGSAGQAGGIIFTVTACLSSNSTWRFIGVHTYLLTLLVIYRASSERESSSTHIWRLKKKVNAIARVKHRTMLDA